MRKNILLPTDFSDNAWSAAEYALKLYKEETCTFHFFHSSKMKISTMSNMSNKLIHVLAENSMKDLTEIKAKAENTNTKADHKFEVILSTHDLYDAMEALIEKNKIDLVIMGTKGATGAKEFFVGSNTVDIINKIKLCPVLVVPDAYEFVTPEQIAFPTDFNRFYGEELLPLKQLSELYHSKIRVAHINQTENLTEKQNYNLAMLKAYLEDYQSSVHWMPDLGSKEQAIKNFIEESSINILAMINYEHSFIENIIKEPVIKKLGFHPTIPFLVIPCLN